MSDEEATLAAQAAKAQKPPVKPYTKLLLDNNWKAPQHDDLSLETLNPARVLDTLIEGPGMDNLNAAQKAVKDYLLSDKVTSLPSATQDMVKTLAAYKLREALADEFEFRTKRAREGTGQVLGAIVNSKPSPDSLIDLTDTPPSLADTPQKLRAALQHLQQPYLEPKVVSTSICSTLDGVVDQALEAIRKAEADGKPADTLDVAGRDFVRGELLAHHKGKRSEQTLDGFGMRLGQARDKLATCITMAKSKGHLQLAVDLLLLSNEVQPAFENFMAIAEKTSFEAAKSLYTSMGNPFAPTGAMSESHWNHLVALAKNAKYREAIESLGQYSPVPLIAAPGKAKTKRRRAPSPDEESSSDEEQPKAKGHKQAMHKRNRPPQKYCTHCRIKGHDKSECRKLQKAKAKQQE